MRRKRTFAATLSVGLHVLVILLLLPGARPVGPSPGGSLGDGNGRGEGIDLTIYDVSQPAPPSLQVKVQDTQALDDLAQLELATPTADPVFELAPLDLSAPLTLSTPDLSLTAAFAAESQTVANQGATGRDGTAKGDNAQLWKMIEPCWRRLADASTSAVTLEVTFSALGNPVTPPVIRRAPGTAPNESALASESQAVAALSDCGPYLFAYGQESVEINFPPIANLADAGT